MDKKDIIEYVMNTPHNTNRAVLEGMLGDTDGVKLPEISEEDEGKVLTVIDGKWDKGVASSDKGYECTEEYTLLTDESVTTTMQEGNPFADGALTYSEPITADSITVTFGGVEYECPRTTVSADYYYGGMSQSGPDFSEYPFAIVSESLQTSANNLLFTETAGTYSVKIETVGSSVETSDCFKKAVRTALPSPLILDINDNDSTLDKTFGEIKDAYLSGRTVLLDPVNPTPILREKSLKSYRLMTELAIDARGGGRIVFSGSISSTFRASSDDEYPVAQSNSDEEAQLPPAQDAHESELEPGN